MVRSWTDKLIGAQLVEVNDKYMSVKKDGRIYDIFFKLDDGGCCGYAKLTKKLFFKPGNKRNPVITSIKKVDKNGDSYYDYAELEITFYGEYEPLATINCECGSGSGWQYGASVSVSCKPLNIDECICYW